MQSMTIKHNPNWASSPTVPSGKIRWIGNITIVIPNSPAAEKKAKPNMVMNFASFVSFSIAQPRMYSGETRGMS